MASDIRCETCGQPLTVFEIRAYGGDRCMECDVAERIAERRLEEDKR